MYFLNDSELFLRAIAYYPKNIRNFAVELSIS